MSKPYRPKSLSERTCFAPTSNLKAQLPLWRGLRACQDIAKVIGDSAGRVFAKGVSWRCEANERPRGCVVKGGSDFLWVSHHNKNKARTLESCQAPRLHPSLLDRDDVQQVVTK